MRENIAVQYYLGRVEDDGRKFHCSCGYKHETLFGGEFECPSCGNDMIVYLEREYKTKIVNTSPFVIDKGLKHFHIAKEKYRLVFHKDGTMSVKYLSNEEIKYSLISGIQYFRNDEEIEWFEAKALVDRFFKDYSSKFVLNIISNDLNRGYYSFAYSNITTQSGWKYKKSWSHSLSGLVGKTYLEILYFSGMPDSLVRDAYINSYSYNKEETKPDKIIGCPKSFFPFIKKMTNINIYGIRGMKKLYDVIGGNNFKNVFTIVTEETEVEKIVISNFCDLMIQLHNVYDYKNIQRLTEYVCRDLKLQQGLDRPVDAMILLKDYIKMMTDLGYKHEKYSKSLKKDHDIAQLNYRIINNSEYTESLAEKVKEKEYRVLEMRGKEFSIIPPTIAEDVVEEGESLSHCVASYVKDIAKGLCKIMFLRRTENLEDSVVTIEIRGNNVRQVRGRSNRVPTEREKEFVKLWAEKKELKVSY